MENKVTMDAYKMLHGCATTIMETQGEETAKKNPFILAIKDAEDEGVGVHICASGGDTIRIIESILESFIFTLKKEGMSEAFVVKKIAEMSAHAATKVQMKEMLEKLHSGDIDTIENLAKLVNIDWDDDDEDDDEEEE